MHVRALDLSKPVFFLAGQNGRMEKDLGVNEVCTSAQCMMYNELHNLASCIVHR